MFTLFDTPPEDGELVYRCQRWACESKKTEASDTWTWFQTSSVQNMDVGAPAISVQNVGKNTTMAFVRLEPSKWRSSPFGDLLDRTSHASEVHQGHQRTEERREDKQESLLWSQEEPVDMEALAHDVQKLLRYGEDGTVEVHRWMTDIPYDAVRGLVKA